MSGVGVSTRTGSRLGNSYGLLKSGTKLRRHAPPSRFAAYMARSACLMRLETLDCFIWAVASVKPMLPPGDAVDHDRGGERLEDPIRDHDGVLDRPLDQQRKLVAAESGDGVSAAHHSPTGDRRLGPAARRLRDDRVRR